MKRNLVVFVSSVAVLSPVVLPGCAQIEDRLGKNRTEAEPVTVAVRTVSSLDAVDCACYVGRVEPSQSAVLTSQYPGTLTELKVKKGSEVTRGQVLAVVNSESVKSAYDIALATRKQAQDGYDRMMEVYAKGGVTQVKKIEVETQLEKAKAAERSALKALENCTVRAPYNGVVDEVFVEKGVELGVGVPVVRLLNVAGVEVHFPVPENEIAAVEVGAFVRIEVPAAGKEFEERVSVKGVTGSAFAHTYDCTVIPSSSLSGVMPGMVCKVWLRDSRGSSLVVPMTAVSTDMQGRYVWTVSPEGIVAKNYVRIGGYSGVGVAVTEGLSEGDVVVVEGARKVSTGMKVKTVER